MTKNPTTYKWASSNGLLKPTHVKIVTTHPLSSTTEYSPAPFTNFHNYNAAITKPSKLTSSYYTSSDPPSSFSTQAAGHQDSSSSSEHAYLSRPTTNPPAPTVIVLGPLGTEYTTVPTQSSPTRINGDTQKYSAITTKLTTNAIKPTLITKKPSVATTLTHNISTIISGNKQVLSVSYISVNLKDGTTSKPSTLKDTAEATVIDSDIKLVTKRPSTYSTLTSWSEKPSFHLKPLVSNFHWSSNNNHYGTADRLTTPSYTTTSSNCEEETAASDDVNNFPPVRHPELDSTVTHLQDKPTLVEPGEIINEDEIPTPDFVEDAELNNKVDVFVNKIVASLQGNFQNLKDVVYNPNNVSTVTSGNIIIKKPLLSTTKRPFTKPTVKGTRKPVSTRITTTQKTLTLKPKPASVGTRKPTSTKRTKPYKKVTTSVSSTDPVLFDVEATTLAGPLDSTTSIPEITPNADFRSSKLLQLTLTTCSYSND